MTIATSARDRQANPQRPFGKRSCKALEQLGFAFARQRGSHIMLYKESPNTCIVVPNHKRIRIGTLRKIIRQTGLSVNEFIELL